MHFRRQLLDECMHRVEHLHRCNTKLFGRAALDAELERIDFTAPHVTVDDLADEIRAGRGELIDRGCAQFDAESFHAFEVFCGYILSAVTKPVVTVRLERRNWVAKWY